MGPVGLRWHWRTDWYFAARPHVRYLLFPPHPPAAEKGQGAPQHGGGPFQGRRGGNQWRRAGPDHRCRGKFCHGGCGGRVGVAGAALRHRTDDAPGYYQVEAGRQAQEVRQVGKIRQVRQA